ncbi:class I SAM-dependent methyltransferase [Nocardia terpenica]|uniref:O-methyltransferase n=1 Tax=Nocardia terpenica TaxID=455432 RepID=UPI001894133A|nr:class I SAM-dependent methyltransferase [Nocardia terpenica]MBF6059450.1 class I SAM-dependent methyltransferase [Nocardia terpenica]MBF6103011.1 class I SAM-dependent methyltransferase [Nocardia terpenica]MBF6110800.1 class I SAM-dependent methyltransferase [Nocardia terpenica]MBF6116931.1 class I SAM-dependent methyltransferase [Nocardia terpenica]MBF6151231.1 class I SAM-dependent methyltransferase [Nocardia terpenica]
MDDAGFGAKLRDRVPFVRWSWLRLGLGMPNLLRTGQVGDGREAALRDHVLAHATADDPDSVLAAIDDFARRRSMLVNIGDEKGLLLDAAVRAAEPKLLLELGAYCGYSAVRTGRLLAPGARLVSVEFNPANAEIARAVLAHAGLDDRVSVVVGRLGDGGATMHKLATEHGFGFRAVDFVFIDHSTAAYLPDLRTILAAGWLHPGSAVLADNVKVPGAPDYLRYMREQEGESWHTVEHRAHVEYQSLLRDVVLESYYLG